MFKKKIINPLRKFIPTRDEENYITIFYPIRGSSFNLLERYISYRTKGILGVGIRGIRLTLKRK